MHTFKRHAAKAILVIMMASSCPMAQAIGWNDLSEYVGNKQKQLSNQIKKHKVIASLLGVASVTGICYVYLGKQVKEMVKRPNELLKTIDHFYGDTPTVVEGLLEPNEIINFLGEDINSLDASITDLRQKNFIYQCFGLYRNTIERSKKKKEELEGFKSKIEGQ